jgi:hypothetical protein
MVSVYPVYYCIDEVGGFRFKAVNVQLFKLIRVMAARRHASMSDNNRYAVTDPESPATPKQIAFLKYLKQSIPRKLTKGQAAQLIDSAKGNVNDKACWISTRRLLFPDLYYEEDVQELYDYFYAHIRSTLRGGSKRLTRKKIVSVIDLLDRTQRGWSAASNSIQVFMAKLNEVYPGCCDEKWQTTQGTEKPPALPSKQSKGKKDHNAGSGCLIIGVIILVVWYLVVN